MPPTNSTTLSGLRTTELLHKQRLMHIEQAKEKGFFIKSSLDVRERQGRLLEFGILREPRRGPSTIILGFGR